MRMVRKKPQNGGPESGTKTDVVSRGAFVKKLLKVLLFSKDIESPTKAVCGGARVKVLEYSFSYGSEFRTAVRNSEP